MPIYGYLLLIISQMAVGSFLNVCIHRLPKNESIVFPPSRCQECKERLKPRDLIPVFSYIFLLGRCGYCRERISFQYLAVEVTVPILAVLLYQRFALSGLFFIYLLLSYMLIVITFIDIKHKIIPDKITLPGMVLGLFLSFFLNHITPLESIIGLLTGGGFLFMVALISRGGMGGGDVKMAAMLGSFLGWQGVLFSIFAGSILGSLAGITMILMGRKNRKSHLPFGPFLSISSMIFFFFGPELITGFSNYVFMFTVPV